MKNVFKNIDNAIIATYNNIVVDINNNVAQAGCNLIFIKELTIEDIRYAQEYNKREINKFIDSAGFRKDYKLLTSLMCFDNKYFINLVEMGVSETYNKYKEVDFTIFKYFIIPNILHGNWIKYSSTSDEIYREYQKIDNFCRLHKYIKVYTDTLITGELMIS